MRTITILILLMIFSSCTKQEDTIELSMSYTYYANNSGETPSTATMITDKGIFHFDLINESGGGSSSSVSISPGTYKVLDVTL